LCKLFTRMCFCQQAV